VIKPLWRFMREEFFGPLPGGIDWLEKWQRLRWPVIGIIAGLAGCGVMALFSAGGGSFSPWAGQHVLRFVVFFGLMLAIALVDVRRWLNYAPWLYGGCLLLLLAVEIIGTVGMGAQRWLDLGFIQLQPSELMKICLVLMLARYYHSLDVEAMRGWQALLPPLLLTGLPVALILLQPNLGTALILLMLAATLTILAGLRSWIIMAGATSLAAAVPVLWHFLHDYQKRRVLTFLDPETDPLGSGYHIMQSKIALGSGGMFGKGYLDGTQSHLNFLPEMQTDFIFTVFGEEFGFFGASIVLILYALLVAYGYLVAFNAQSQYARMLAVGLSTNLFLYLFINTGMIMGLLPVVGVPLPLLSYGGTSLLAVMIGFGLLLNLDIHRELRLPLRGTG
jgi:rod shape determining protein RodA